MARWGGRDNFGLSYANKLFDPTGAFLHDLDTTMDWRYKLRAVIGAGLLIAVGIRYHQSFKTVTGNFNPVLGGVGGVLGSLFLGLFAVVPATACVVCYTHKGKRGEAFGQMLRYPVKTAAICWGIYGVSRLLDQNLSVLRDSNPAAEEFIGLVGGVLCLRYCLFFFRGIYLVTVGLFRMGDGHPLLPPIVGSIIPWAAVIKPLMAGPAGSGEPSRVWVAALIAGPASVTLLGYTEIRRLRKKYPAEFPFRDGPLPELQFNQRAEIEPDEPVAGGQHSSAVPWSDEDQGRLRAYQLYQRLRDGGAVEFIPSARCPVRLKSREKCLAFAKARLYEWKPEQQRHVEVGTGDLVLTDWDLIHVANGRTRRFRRAGVTVGDGRAPLDLTGDHSRVGISFEFRTAKSYAAYWLDLAASDRRYFKFMLENVYEELRYDGKVKASPDFIERARALGKL